MNSALTALGYEECFQLLGSTSIGRVVGTAGALPLVVPVCFALDGHGIVFRAAPGGSLAAATAGSVVAFQADDVDPVSSCGWSVVVTGVAHHMSGSELLRVVQTRVEPWLPADHAWVRITPGLVTGRRLEQPSRDLRRRLPGSTPAA